MVKVRFSKLGLPKMAAINGVMMSLTSAWITALNASPMTTAMARSITLPRKMNCLNPLSMVCPSLFSYPVVSQVPDTFEIAVLDEPGLLDELARAPVGLPPCPVRDGHRRPRWWRPTAAAPAGALEEHAE